MRAIVIALLLLLSMPATAQVLTGSQDARVRALVAQLTAEARRCSLDANAKDRVGPARVQLELDTRGKLRRLTVLDDLPRTDVGKCIASFKPTGSLPQAKFTGGKTIRLELGFHPWANRGKRSWKAVRKELRDGGVEAAVYKCLKAAGKKRPKKLGVAIDFSREGAAQLTSEWVEGAECLQATVSSVKLDASDMRYRVEYEWTRKSRPTVARGSVVEPDECEVEEYPCSWAEADAERVRLGNDYVRQLGERIDCKAPQPAIAWLEKQPHVRWVRADGCNVSMLIDGARPMTFLGNL